MGTLKAGAVARVFGRSPNWLRDLERRGIIPPAPRDFVGYRQYTAQDVEVIRSILAKRARTTAAAPA